MSSDLAQQLFSQAFETELLQEVEKCPDLGEWGVAGKGKVKSRPNGEDVAWWRANGPDMVDGWIEWRKTHDDWRIWETPGSVKAVELPVTVDMGDVDLVMHIDRVFTTPYRKQLAIVDLKSGSRTPESDLQLGVYRYGLKRRFGVEARFGAYYMARKGELSEVFDLRRFTDTLIGDMFGTYESAIANKIFLPHITFRCRACSLRDYCAAYGGSKANTVPTQRG